MKKAKKKLQIENTSNWPDPFVDVICEWVIGQTSINMDIKGYWIEVKNSQAYSGNGHLYSQTVRMNRRYGKYPRVHKDHRFKWSKEFEFKSRVEFFVFLIAHEAYHSVLWYKRKSKVAENEFLCNDFGYGVVKKFRVEWPKLKVKIKRSLLREHKKMKTEKQWQKKLLQKKQEVKLKKNTTEYKLEKVEKLLDKWEKNKKNAENKIAFYKKKVSRFEKIIERKKAN